MQGAPRATSWLKSLDKKTIDAIFSQIVVDGSLLDGLDMFQLLEELQIELANLPSNSKSGKSFSGKSGKSLKDNVLAQVVVALLELLPSSQPSFQLPRVNGS